jgi:hypothetical protein
MSRQFLVTLCNLLIPAASLFAQLWTATSAPTNYWNAIASSSDGTRLLAADKLGVSNFSSVYVSTNAGTTWIAAITLTNINWASVASSADGTKMFAAAQGVILGPGGTGSSLYSSGDSGVTWTQMTAPVVVSSSIAASGDGTKLAVAVGGFGGQGPIYTSTNSGQTWTQTSAPQTSWGAIASSADGAKLAAAVAGGITPVGPGQFVTNTGLIYTSGNGGATWATAGPTLALWGSIASSADGTRLAACVELGGGIYISTNSGNSWTKTTAPTGNWSSVASSADGTRLAAVVYHGPIYTSINSGVTWISNNIAPSYWTAIASSADGGALAVVDYPGGIVTSRSTLHPNVRMASDGGNAVISWIVPSTNFVLQWAAGPSSTWDDVSTPPGLNLTTLEHQVVIPPTNSQGFYRLETR